MSRQRNPSTKEFVIEGVSAVTSERTGGVTFRARVTYTDGGGKRRFVGKTFKAYPAAAEWKLETDLKIRRSLAAHYEALLRVSPDINLAEVDAEIARQAAVLRATYRLRTPDAIQVAACLTHGATAFVTNDIRLRRIEELAVIVLADHMDG